MLKRVLQTSPLIAALVIGVAYAPTPLTAQANAQEAQEPETESLDELLLSTGLIVRGKILEETATEIVFELRKPGFPPVKTRYLRSEIQSITRDVATVQRTADTGDMRDRDGEKDETKNDDPDATQIYYFSITGRFGRDVSQTPLARIMEDMNEVFGDAVPNPEQGGSETIVDPAKRDQNIAIIHLRSSGSERQGFLEIFRAEEIIPILEHEIHQRGRRAIFLVEEAVNGASFMPWLSPEIYFTPDGTMYFTSDFDLYDTGDQMVNEKLIGAHIGTAQGFAILGGHAEVGPQIIKAMSRGKYWLSVLWTGTTPRLSLRQPRPQDIAEGWEVLSDDGIDDRDDTLQQEVRNPNDQLRLEADTAFRLGVSEGTVADLDELLFMIGVHRNYNLVDHDADKIKQGWQDDLQRFMDQAYPGDQRTRPGKLWREFREIAIPGDFNGARKARGRQLSLLKRIRSIVNRVKEVADPNGQLISQIETQIYIIETQQQLANENR